MIALERIDLEACNEIVAQTSIKDLGLEGKIKMMAKYLFKAGLHLVVGKKNPRAQEIKKIFNSGMKR